jgi:hypothetical protein
MSFSIALIGFGFADCRKALKRVSVSPESFMALIGLIIVATLPKYDLFEHFA